MDNKIDVSSEFDAFKPEKICVTSDIERKDNICYLKYKIFGIACNHGNTVGNALRRVVLASTMGIAIYSFSCSLFKHEFDSCLQIQEDANIVMYHLKRVIIMYDENINDTQLSFTFRGPIHISAKMLEKDNIRILNTDQHIMHICDNVEVKLVLYIRRSMGFSIHCDNVTDEDVTNNIIGVTAVYSKIINVNYKSSRDIVDNKLDIVEFTIDHYDVYSDDHFVMRNALQYCVAMYSTILHCLVNRKTTVFEQEDGFQRKKRLMDAINDLQTEFGQALVVYVNSLSFNSFTELIEKHLNDPAKYKTYGIRKRQYKDLISRIQRLADESEDSSNIN